MPYNPLQTVRDLRFRGPRKPLKMQQVTTHEAKQEAQRLIHAGLVGKGSKTRALIDVMSSAGVLPSAYLEEFIQVNARTVRRYREKSLLERVPIPPALGSIFPPTTHFFYALGMVGIELATLIHGMTPKGYIEAEQDKVSHDVLTNLVYYHLYKGVKPLGYSAILYSRYEATVHDYKGRSLLQPDAMVIFEHPTKARQVCLIEYHHENFGRRAEGKVLKYERLVREHPEDWRTTWQTAEPPTVLVVWTHKAVGTGYRKYFEQRHAEGMCTQSRWLGKPLQTFLEKQTVLLWDNLTTGQANDRLLK